MDSDTFQKMTFEECCRAMEITKQATDEEEKEIVSLKKKWTEGFKPLLKFVLDNTEDGKIESKDLTGLWLFYVDGIHIRNLFEKLDQKQLNSLLSQSNPIEEILEDNCGEITKCGIFLYQTAYYSTMIKLKLEESLIRYKSIYCDDNPINWLKNNNKTWELNIHNTALKEKGGLLCRLWTRLYKVSNLSLDPIFQT